MRRKKLDKGTAFCEHKACHHPRNMQRKCIRVCTFEDEQGNISQIYLVQFPHSQADCVIWKNPDAAGRAIRYCMPSSSSKEQIKTKIMQIGESLNLSFIGTFKFETEGKNERECASGSGNIL